MSRMFIVFKSLAVLKDRLDSSNMPTESVYKAAASLALRRRSRGER